MVNKLDVANQTLGNVNKIIAAVEAHGSKTSDVLKLVGELNKITKTKDTKDTTSAVTTGLKPTAKTKDVQQVTSTLKSVQKAVETHPISVTVTTPLKINIDGKQLATTVTQYQTSTAKATGNVHGRLAGSTQTGTGVAR